MDSKYILYGGIGLLALVVLASFVFSPSGLVTKAGVSAEYVCAKANTNYERCDGSGSNFWKENTFKSDTVCNTVVDETSTTCIGNNCKCKQLRN